MMRLDQLFGSLRPGEAYQLVGRRPLWGCFIYLSALRLDDGDFLFMATSGAPQAEALDTYADRWHVETLFGALKSRGLNLEDTHLTDPKRLAKLMGLLALAFAWTYRTGELLHDGPSPIRQKNLAAPPQVTLPPRTRLPPPGRFEPRREIRGIRLGIEGFVLHSGLRHNVSSVRVMYAKKYE
jgi:hypothetical protein